MRIRVDGQNLIREEEKGGQEGEFSFVFSRDWDRFVKFAQFTQAGKTWNTMLVENRCHVPPEIREGPFYLNVTGMTADSHDRATSCYIMLTLKNPPPGTTVPLPAFPESREAGGRDLYSELNQRMDDAIRRSSQLLLDESLSRSGMAAEARATGEALTAARQAAREALTEEAGRLLEEIGQVRAGLEALDGRAAQGERGRAETEARLGTLERQLAEMKAGSESDLSSLHAEVTHIQTLKAHSEAQDKRLENVESAAGKAQTGLSEVREALSEAKQAVQALSGMRETVAQVQKREEALGAALQAQESRLTELRETQSRDAGERLLQQEKTRHLEEAMERQRSRSGESAQRLRALEGKVEQLPGRHEMEGLEKRLGECERGARETGSAIDVLNKTVLAVQVTLDRLRGSGNCEGNGDGRALRRADDAMELAGRAAREAEGVQRRLSQMESDQTRFQTRVNDMLSGAVRIQQGSQNAGRILGISEDGRVVPVDKRLTGQVQADLAQRDSAEADYVKNKPFEIYDGYMAVPGLVLMAPDRTPYLLRVNERGELSVAAFTM
ncbi:MAG: hypothetical protein IJ708_05990 [Clostridia bacterium]|nr:hypothetical protein [Clostridia bacterium]